MSDRDTDDELWAEPTRPDRADDDPDPVPEQQTEESIEEERTEQLTRRDTPLH